MHHGSGVSAGARLLKHVTEKRSTVTEIHDRFLKFGKEKSCNFAANGLN